MRRREDVPASPLEDAERSPEVLHQVIRMQMLDYLIRDHDVIEIRRFKTGKMHTVRDTPGEVRTCRHPFLTSFTSDLGSLAAVPEVGEVLEQACLPRSNFIDGLGRLTDNLGPSSIQGGRSISPTLGREV